MPYLNETGLAYYSEKLKPWIASQPVKTIPSSLNPWTLSDKAGAVTCWPVGGTPLLPTVDFLFTETGPAEGTKGPDNPSTITGVSSVKVTRCGKNLLPIPAVGTTTINQVGFTVNADGSITVNGTASADADFFISPNKIPTFGKTIFISGCPSGGSLSTYSLHLAVYNGSIVTFVNDDFGSGYLYVNANPRQIIASIRIKSGFTANNLVFYPQIEFSSTATSFESYSGNDYTLPLGNTYYGGSIDLATGVMTVTHAAIKIGDISGFTYRSDFSGCWTPASTLQPGASYTENPVCTHAIFTSGADFSSATDGVFRWGAGGTNKTWWYYKSTATTPEEFYAEYGDAYLAFKIQVPYTVLLTPTQILALPQSDKYTPRLNTIYTDASAVQVGYVKSPIREEYELTQAVVAQGGNI